MALKHLGIPATGTSAEALAPFSTRPEIRKFLDFKAAVTFPRNIGKARHECTGAESLQGRSNPPKLIRWQRPLVVSAATCRTSLAYQRSALFGKR